MILMVNRVMKVITKDFTAQVFIYKRNIPMMTVLSVIEIYATMSLKSIFPMTAIIMSLISSMLMILLKN